jgi:quercetin dioxygenase-like cupin family protein
MNFRRGLIYAAVFASGAASLALAQSGYPPLEVLLSTSQTTIGQEIAYPPGKPKITAAIVTMEPGANTGRHRHEAPLFAMILEGEVSLDYGNGVTRSFKRGDTFLEAFQTSHEGTNTGDQPVRILVVFAGSDSVKNTIMEP